MEDLNQKIYEFNTTINLLVSPLELLVKKVFLEREKVFGEIEQQLKSCKVNRISKAQMVKDLNARHQYMQKLRIIEEEGMPKLDDK